MTPRETKDIKESIVFLIGDMADVQISVNKVCTSKFLKEALDIDRSLIGTMISELGTNIIKYAGRGTIRMTKVGTDSGFDIEIWAEDKGPGISNIELALQDHFSTGNTLGLGLPAVRRMADDFRIQSEKGHGTVVYVRKHMKDLQKNHSSITKSSKDSTFKQTPSQQTQLIWDVGFYNRPMAGECVSGDSITIVEFDSCLLLALVDVSGHGVKAHELGTTISNYILQVADRDLATLMSRLHDKLMGTLGAAVGLLLVDIETQTFKYIGVGNTYAGRCIGQSWRGVSRDGILGQRLPSANIQVGNLRNGDVFAMWSDGLRDHIGSSFVKSHGYEAAEKIARDLVHELGKQHDDASCIIFKWLA
jgi:anti-sigma regulatory factor (Ser/Thr protein kinase)